MKSRYDAGFFAGVLLILGGLAFLLSNLLPDTRATELVFAAGFAAAGLLFGAMFIRSQAAWTLPVAAGGVGLGVVTAIDAIAPGAFSQVGAAFIFVLVGAAFAVLMAVPAVRWWPVIPAGVLLTLGATTLMAGAAASGAVFLAGLGLTFVAVYLVPPQPLKRGWALIPATVLVLLALPASGLAGQSLGVAVALALIVGGLLMLLVRAPRRKVA